MTGGNSWYINLYIIYYHIYIPEKQTLIKQLKTINVDI